MIGTIQGNCLDIMKSFPDHSIDLILADPPYGTTTLKWDSVIPLEPLWVQYRRILKPTGTIVLCCSEPFTSVLICSNLPWFRYRWTWNKIKPTGYLMANARPMRVLEDIAVFSPVSTKAGSTYNPQGLRALHKKKKNNPKRLGILGEQPEHHKHLGKQNQLLSDTEYEQHFTGYPKELIEFAGEPDKLHPTQKPVPLMEYLVRTYSNPGELVLDNCMGAGTPGVACVRTGRQFIGIEQDEHYFRLATERIEAELPTSGSLAA